MPPLARLRHVAPYLLGAALFAMGLSALHHLLAAVHPHEIAAAIHALPWRVTMLAMLTTGAGYLCLAGYDWSALRHIGKSLPPPVVLAGGMMAYAFGNTIGLTVVSGGAVRWRFYSGLGLDGYDIASVSAFTAIVFGVMTMVVGFGALALHPAALALIVPLDAGSARLLALAAIAALVLPLIWASVRGKTLRMGHFVLHAPRLPVLAGQVVIGTGDLVFSSLTLWLFLPAGGPDFFTFAAIFAAASMAGVISHVPGGIGVFEAVILAALPAGMGADKVAAALLMYRLTYYLVPFGLSLVFLSLHEGWRALGGRVPANRFGQAMHIIEPAIRALRPLGSLVLAAVVFGSGLWMTVSSLLPPMTAAAEAAETIFPLTFTEGSVLVASILGAMLIVLALGVARRLLAAYWLALAAMAVAAVIALAQADTDQAAALALLVVLMIPFRPAFNRRTMLTHAALTPAWAVLLACAVTGLGFALFFAHKSTPYASELWWQFGMDARAPRALRAMLLASLTVGLGACLVLFSVPKVRPGRPDAATLATAARLAAASDSPDAGFALSGDKSILLSDDARAFVMFGTAGRSWIALGAPTGAADAVEAVAFRFVDAARRAGAAPVFYEVGPAAVPLMLDLGMTLHKMGEKAVVDLRGFSLEGPARKRLRASHARALRDGLSLRIASPPHDAALLDRLHVISDEWLGAGKVHEKGFSVGRFDPAWLAHWPLALVEQNGIVVAFANIMTTTTKRRSTIDLMRHSAQAPASTMEFLFTALMLALKKQGHAEFSLGMAPFSGLSPERSRKLWDRFGALLYQRGGHFYNFSGLRAFKEKFDPDWQPHYLATSGSLLPVAALVDAARLIARHPAQTGSADARG